MAPEGAFLMFMFSGIISHLGIFIGQTKDGFKFRLPRDLIEQVHKGCSIAVNGVCLTVKKSEEENIYVDVMEETMKKTAFGSLKDDDLVNLELPVTSQTLLSGHIVQGHVDGTARLIDVKKGENGHIMKFSLSPAITKYIVSKGSIALNGISLTVIEAGQDFFSVGIIPFTLKNTMLHALKTGDFVNIEVDVLAKYVERLLKQ